MIWIGAAQSRRNPDASGTTPDDRQELVKTMDYSSVTGQFVGSVQVVDLGRVPTGDVMAFTGVVFSAANWAIVEGIWLNRTLVSVVDEAGQTFASCRVKVTKHANVPKFPGYVTADLEVWRV